MYKLSKYNHFIDWEDRLFLIFNARIGSLLEVNRENYLFLNERVRKEGYSAGMISDHTVKRLLDNEILIPVMVWGRTIAGHRKLQWPGREKGTTD